MVEKRVPSGVSGQVSLSHAFGAVFPLVALTGLLISIFSYPFISRNPKPILDLSKAQWNACYAEGRGDCELFSIEVPKDVTAQLDKRFKGSIYYRVKFMSPAECLASEVGCTLYIAELGDAASITLNGKELPQHGRLPPHGRYAKHYPVKTSIPSDFFLRGRENMLEISAFSFKNIQGGIRKGPVGLFWPDDAFVLGRVQLTQTVIMPLISAALMFLIALITVGFTFLKSESNVLLNPLIRYCAATSFYLFSFSELPREIIPMPFAITLHYMARMLSCFCFFDLVRISFFDRSILLKRLGIIYYVVIATYPIIFLESLVGGNASTDVFNNVYRVARMTFPILILPHLIGLMGSFTIQKSKLRYALMVVFFLTAACQINDSLVFSAMISGNFFARIYPVLIALVMSWFHFHIIAQEILAETLKLKTEAAIGTLASQVAHDIRSPLAALNAVEKELGGLGEEKRLLIRSAVNRIKDIANNLINQNQIIFSGAIAGQAPLQSPAIQGESDKLLLSTVLDSLVTEKRMQYRSKIGIDLDFRMEGNGGWFFVSVQPSEFKRALSNVINNAVEALGDSGKVEIRLSTVENQIQIAIRDNGRGIPPELLEKIGERGATFGKIGGTGLGLYHARTAIESWGGSLRINSTTGIGTEIYILLPRAEAPVWFVSQLQIEPNSTIVILDDDMSIHRIWRGRFESLHGVDHGVKVFHFSTPEDIRNWVKKNGRDATVFLLDYEIIGHQETGLSLIVELELCSCGILVTSRFEERSILNDCVRFGVRMIPKGMAGFVPIVISNPRKKLDAVLIDDDELVRKSWEISAVAQGMEFLSFSSPDQFYSASREIALSTPIYVDSNLGMGIKGEFVSKRIVEMGFKRTYLATGFNGDTLPSMPWLSGVRGKEAPWEVRQGDKREVRSVATRLDG